MLQNGRSILTLERNLVDYVCTQKTEHRYWITGSEKQYPVP